MKNLIQKKIMTGLVLITLVFMTSMLSSCREYDEGFDIAYFFKTGPEKAVIDFLHCLDHNDPEYIYYNLMPASERNSISREKYSHELSLILEEVESITINRTVYLGYEGQMSKVVAEFDIKYYNSETREYKKYFYLVEENGRWRIIIEKTFI